MMKSGCFSNQLQLLK